ncbi:MAG: hypothetical protein E7576_17250 [Ruminococcaceae bacterium]|jgi:3D (Asp-Asp-Asp) domain-containing protein|nr:hypothetical protein [Oscillospiraceae bacterium]
MMDKEWDRDDGVPGEEKSWASYDEAADALEAGQEKSAASGAEPDGDAEIEKSANEGEETPVGEDAPKDPGEPREPEEREEPEEPDGSEAPEPEGSIDSETAYEPDGDDSVEEDGADFYEEDETEYDEDVDFDPDYYKEGDENLAEIAERILGGRHSKASTAAPIRTRADRMREAGLKKASDQEGEKRKNARAAVNPVMMTTAEREALNPAILNALGINAEGQKTEKPADSPDSLAEQNPPKKDAKKESPAQNARGEKPAVNPAFMSTAERQAVRPGPGSNGGTGRGKPAPVNPALMNTAERKAVNPAAFMNTAERQALRAEREKAAAAVRAKEEAARKKKRTVTAIVASLCAVLILGGAIGAGIGISRRNRAVDAGEISTVGGDDAQTNENGDTTPAQSPAEGEDGQTVEQDPAALPGEEGSDPVTAPEPTDSEPANGPDENDNAAEPAENTEPSDGGDAGSSDQQGTAGTPSDAEPPSDGGTSAAAENPPADNPPANTTPADNPPADNTPAVEPKPEAKPDPEPTPKPDPEPVKTPDPKPAATWQPAQKFRVEIDFYNRDPIIVETEPTSVGQILLDNGITLKDGEQASIGLWDWLTDSVTCSIDYYEYVYEDETVVVPFETEEIGVDTIPRGTVETIQEGSNGVTVNHWYVAKKNGVEFDRRLEWEEVTSYPQNAQVYTGVGGTLVGKDGITYSYSYRRVCPALCYNFSDYTWAGTYTSSRTVAADFNYFPLGTKMYVKNDRYDLGYRVVEDTGDQTYAWEVDVWLDAADYYYPLMSQEGVVWDMVVYILD